MLGLYWLGCKKIALTNLKYERQLLGGFAVLIFRSVWMFNILRRYVMCLLPVVMVSVSQRDDFPLQGFDWLISTCNASLLSGFAK